MTRVKGQKKQVLRFAQDDKVKDDKVKGVAAKK